MSDFRDLQCDSIGQFVGVVFNGDENISQNDITKEIAVNVISKIEKIVKDYSIDQLEDITCEYYEVLLNYKDVQKFKSVNFYNYLARIKVCLEKKVSSFE